MAAWILAWAIHTPTYIHAYAHTHILTHTPGARFSVAAQTLACWVRYTHAHIHTYTYTHSHTPGARVSLPHGSWPAGRDTRAHTSIYTDTLIYTWGLDQCGCAEPGPLVELHAHIHTHTRTYSHTHTHTRTHTLRESVWLPGSWPGGRGTHTRTHSSGDHSPFPQERVSKPGRNPRGGFGPFPPERARTTRLCSPIDPFPQQRVRKSGLGPRGP